MSYYDYHLANEINRQDHPFYALIMAAMLKADSNNARLLQVCWPHIWAEVEARYNAPGGYLPGEKDAS